MAKLHDLSPELLSIILESIAWPPDLNNLITASKACHSTFLAAPQRILGQVLKKAFGLNFQHALAAFYASRMAKAYNRKEAIETMMNDYHAGSLRIPPSFENVAEISRMYLRTQRFIKDYSFRASKIMFNDFQASYLPIWSQPSYNERLSQYRLVLSPIEHARLTRAFLRFEIYCHSFPLSHSVNESQIFTRQDQAKLFLSRISRWEIEELCSVHQYFFTLVDMAATHLEDFFVDEVYKLSKNHSYPPKIGPGEQPTPSSDSCSEDAQRAKATTIATEEMFFVVPQLETLGLDLFSGIADRRRDRILSHACAQGQEFISNLMFAETSVQVCQIAESYPRFGDFLDDALLALPRGVSELNANDEFDGIDRLRQCNQGWTLLSARNYDLVSTGLLSRKPERYLGFVFWDSHRLKDANTNCPPMLALPGRLSAQERLEGIRVPSSLFKEITQRYSNHNIAKGS